MGWFYKGLALEECDCRVLSRAARRRGTQRADPARKIERLDLARPLSFSAVISLLYTSRAQTMCFSRIIAGNDTAARNWGALQVRSVL